MSDQEETIQSISKNDFVAAKDAVHAALFAKARELVNLKKQEIAPTLVNQEIDNEQTTQRREG